MLAGNRAAIVWVPGSDRWPIMPVALLDPPRPGKAGKQLRGCSLTVRWENDLLWIAPPGSGDTVDRLTETEGDLSGFLEIEQRSKPLQAGGLVQARINPAAFGELLRSQVIGKMPAPVEWLAAMAVAELEAVHFAGFRRDLVGDQLLTEAVVEYNTTELPEQVAAVLDPEASHPPMPASLPEETVLATAWRTEAASVIPWMQHVARVDRHGPLRNLEFWLDDFGEQTGGSIENDLLGCLGEHGWLFFMAEPARAVTIIEATDGARLEKAVRDFTTWLGEIASYRSLGLVATDRQQVLVDGKTAYFLDVSTPFGDLEGPVWTVTDDHLLIGTGFRALQEGLRILEGKENWRPTDAHATIRVNFRRLALPFSGLEDGQAVVNYEKEAIRIRGRVSLPR
jgi:hypothetical protein